MLRWLKKCAKYLVMIMQRRKNRSGLQFYNEIMQKDQEM